MSHPQRPDNALQTLTRSAGPAFLVLGFFGRLPAAMNQLGMLLIVAASGRGLGLAGTTVAAVGLGTAVGAPLMGRAADRFGPVHVLYAAMLVQVAALMGILYVLSHELSSAVILACAAVMGAANPQASSMARACWSGIARSLRDPGAQLRTIRVGLGFETASDETSFVLGPVMAGVLVTALGAQGAALALALLTVLGEGCFALWLARHPQIARPTPVASAKAMTTDAQPTPWAQLMPVLVTIAAVGVVFGTTQTTLTALHTAAGTPELTGYIYGAMGVTSAVAGLLAPSLGSRVLAKTAVAGAIVVLCSSTLLSVPTPLPTLAAVMSMGFGVGTALSLSYTRVEEAAATGRVTSLMTLAATSNVLGVSFGAWLTGHLAANLHHAELPAVVAGVVVLVVALVQMRFGSRPRSRHL